MPHPDPLSWAAHIGHRLTVSPAQTDDGSVTGTAIYCLRCRVQLAVRTDPDSAAGCVPAGHRPTLLDEVMDLAAGLRSALQDAMTPDPQRPAELRDPSGHVYVLPALDDDPYWRGFRAASRASQQAMIAALCQQMEHLAARHLPATDLEAAGRFVRASVIDRLRLLRARLAAPVPAPWG